MNESLMWRGLGLVPNSPFHVLALIPPVIIWWVTRRWARKQGISRYHRAVFAVSFWEEALFRGLIYSLTFWLTGSMVAAIVSSSLLFGLFHLRNLWWADKKRVLVNCLYAGLFIGPLLAALRGYSGDIYLGILGHFLNNFVFLLRSRDLPTDKELNSKRRN